MMRRRACEAPKDTEGLSRAIWARLFGLWDFGVIIVEYWSTRVTRAMELGSASVWHWTILCSIGIDSANTWMPSSSHAAGSAPAIK
jgi:hypothetical protein